MNNKSDQPFSHLKELPLSDGAIELSKLIKVKISGTHIIYKLNENSLFLLKIAKESIVKEPQELESELHNLINKYDLLYQAFGESRCLVEYRCIHLIKEKDSSVSKNAIISLVEYDKCFDSNKKFGFVTESIESHGNQIRDNLLKYHQMNMSLLGDNASRVPFDSGIFLYFHKSFKPIFQLLETEKSLQNAMTEFLEKFKTYYNQTGQLMDFTGYNNVLFYKENNIWQYKIGNVIKNETRETVKSKILEINTNAASATRDWTNIIFAPSWIRTLNATGEKLKLGRIIEDITLSREDSENLSRIYKELPLDLRSILLEQEKDFEKMLGN